MRLDADFFSSGKFCFEKFGEARRTRKPADQTKTALIAVARDSGNEVPVPSCPHLPAVYAGEQCVAVATLERPKRLSPGCG